MPVEFKLTPSSTLYNRLLQEYINNTKNYLEIYLRPSYKPFNIIENIASNPSSSSIILKKQTAVIDNNWIRLRKRYREYLC